MKVNESHSKGGVFLLIKAGRVRQTILITRIPGIC